MKVLKFSHCFPAKTFLPIVFVSENKDMYFENEICEKTFV